VEAQDRPEAAVHLFHLGNRETCEGAVEKSSVVEGADLIKENIGVVVQPVAAPDADTERCGSRVVGEARA